MTKHKTIDPWGADLVGDYSRLIKDFGLEAFELTQFPDPNKLMRRGIVFAGRDLEIILRCINRERPFYVLSGIMPTGEKIHFGNKMVIDNIAYFQRHGATAFVLVADLEAQAARGISLEEGRSRAMSFHIPAYIALGLDIKKTVFYFQSENMGVIHLAYRFSNKVTLNEFRAIYGQADPGRIVSALTQAGDILYPQLKERMPGIIPVGIDQDPHIRLTRDIVSRTKDMKFFPPSSLYHKYMPALDGSLKMSKSRPDSFIELPEDENSFSRKISRAKTGGRETVAIQKEKGGIPENCMVFELLKQHLVEDDAELHNIYDRCRSGNLLCGECKQHCIELMKKFMHEFNHNLEYAKKHVHDLHFVTFK